MTAQLGSGPALGVSALVPDLHYSAALEEGHYSTLSRRSRNDAKCDRRIAGASVWCFQYRSSRRGFGCLHVRRAWRAVLHKAILQGIGHARTTSASHKNSDLFLKGVTLGRRLIWLHTYAERFGGDDRGNQVPKGRLPP